MICILLGFLLGLSIMPWISQYYDGHPEFQFPTSEMLSRGELRSLWVGVLIAVPSGAGVALSVLGGNNNRGEHSHCLIGRESRDSVLVEPYYAGAKMYVIMARPLLLERVFCASGCVFMA